jgi:hypothetical protein
MHEHGVLAGDGDVVEEDVVVGRAADRGSVALRAEVLTRPSAARANDQRRALGRDLLERAVSSAISSGV